MEWKTAISDISDDEERVRGYELKELIGRLSFSEAIWLLLQGELATPRQSAMLDAILVSMIEHGIGVASVMAARTIASCTPSLSVAAAGGLLTVGEYHGGAVASAARMLQEAVSVRENAEKIVAQFAAEKKRIPGFGHRVLSRDLRAEKLREIAALHSFIGPHTKLMEEIGAVLNRGREKSLPLNVDGMTAAIVSDMGFDHRLCNGFFAISRLPGLVAHIAEEQARERPLRRLLPEECMYDGVPRRKLPESPHA